jgi:hypothetical protein
MPSGSGPPATNRRGIGWHVSWLLAALGMTAALATITSWLPEPFPGQRARRTQAVLLEYQSLCGKLGIDPLPSHLANCVADLTELRSRDQREAIFF